MTPMTSPETRLPAEGGRVRALVLGVDAWAVGLFVPLLLAGTGGGLLAVSMLPLAALGIGVALWPRRGAVWWVLGVFPVMLVGVVGLADRGGAIHETATLALAALALALHVFGVAAVVRPAPRSGTTVRPLTALAVDHAAMRRARVRTLVLCLCGVGAAALAVVVPTWGSSREVERVFGDSAQAASAFVATVAVVLSVAVLAGLVAPATRLPRAVQPGRRSTRVALLSMVVVMGAGVWYLLHR